MRKDSLRKRDEILGKEFDTKVQAFQAYKQAKELYIKEVVRDYKESLCSIVYQTLINWEIGADD